MTDITGSSGVTPPPPTTTPPNQPPKKNNIGKLGALSVTPVNPDQPSLKEKQQITQSDTPISKRTAVVQTQALSKEQLKLILGLVNSKQWEGLQSALKIFVTSYEQFERLAEKTPAHIPTEAMQIIADRYAVLAAEKIAHQLKDIQGSAAEQLDNLNLLFVQPHNPHNPVRTVVSAVANDFMQTSGFSSSLQQSLTNLMETTVFHQLYHHALQLDKQAISSGDESVKTLVEQQATQRRIEIGA